MTKFQSHVDPGDEDVPKRFILSDLAVGKALRIITRNSTYEIRKQAGGATWRIEQTKASSDPDAYILSPNPCIGGVGNFELRPGISLVLWRDSPIKGAIVRLTRTSAIQSVEEIR